MLGGDRLNIFVRAEFPGRSVGDPPFSGEAGSETSCMVSWCNGSPRVVEDSCSDGLVKKASRLVWWF